MGRTVSIDLDQLENIGIKEVLEHDPRPTFILDLDPDDLKLTRRNDTLRPVFSNEALRSHHVLLDALSGEPEDVGDSAATENDFAKFKTWATSVTKFDDSKDVYPLTHLYRNMLWTASTIRKRWRLISGNQCYRLPDLPPQSHTRTISSHKLTESYATELTPKNNTDHPHGCKEVSENHLAARIVPLPQAKLVAHDSRSTTDTQSTSNPQNEHNPGRPKFSSRSSTGTIKTSESTWSITLSTPEKGTPDWTVPNPIGMLSEHIKFARSIDWAATPLGEMSSWSRELRQAANLVMANAHPAALFWGSDLTMLYNEAYRDEVAGNKHPNILGTGAEGPFREIWDHIAPIFAECARTGKSVRMENDNLSLYRFGYLEEVSFSWSITPLCGGGSKILGFYNAPFETTHHVLAQRRMQTLQHLGSVIGTARTVKEFWRMILLGLEDNHPDIPFALLYSVAETDDSDEISVSSGSTLSLKSCILEGSIGVPPGHAAAPDRLDLKRSREGFIPSFRDAMRTREPTRLQIRDGTLPEHLLEGIQWRGFGEPCNEAIIFPLRPTNGDSVLSFLLIGVNPRRAYDAEYKAFVTLLNWQLATALASVLLSEEETRKSQAAIDDAVLQQEELNEQLALQTNRLQRMTALSPLGMFYLTPAGLIVEANDRYFEMTLQDRDDLREMSWMDQLTESSIPAMLEGWHKLTVELVPWSSELQFKHKHPDSVDTDSEPMDYWVLATSQPELTIDGKLRCVMGSITDISHLKWAQGLQDRRLREAEERRRQQNEFIDITSHEMRNPLSAILQCADDITSSMTEYQEQRDKDFIPLIASCIESAHTISICVQHQKSIVDDILTVSKLDSNLLELAPTPAQPIVVAKTVMRMFESELIAKKIKFSFVTHPDYEALGVDWVSMDPSRVSQVLINLMTNAIKFTGERAKREIKMQIGASTDIPVNPNTPNLHYIPRRNTITSRALGDDWGSGAAVYIRLKVMDTGCGLTPDEKQLLFQRFQQASPRTHAQYGGSGLGLFISRQLTELHGGQIGVASEAGVGSTFGFYIRTRRCVPLGQETLPPPLNETSAETSLNSNLPAKPTITVSRSDIEIPTVTTIPKLPRSVTLPVIAKTAPTLLHILVVEDNLVNQRVLVKQLQKVGSTVFTADNGQKALDFLETTEYRIPGSGQKLSVVLMDLEMPVMDGLTCVRVIRQMQKEGVINRHVPIIAVTANVRQEQIHAAKEAGMDQIVSKPFRIPELLAKIEGLLSENGKAGNIDLIASASMTSL